MSQSIDQLQIDISAQAVKANTAIDGLVGKIDRLSASLQGLNSSSLIGLANGVQKLATSMQSMNNVNTPAFNRLAKNIQKLGSIDTASINKASNSMSQMSRSLKGLGSVSDSAAQITSLAKGISQLGYKSSTQAIENIPKLATAMKDLMSTLSKAPQVSQNLINMTNALAKLARTGASGGKAANAMSKNLHMYSNSTTKATRGTFNLASALGKMYATYWMLFRAFGKLGEAIDLSSSVTEVQNVVDVTFGQYKKLVEDMAKTSIPEFGMSELTVKQIASRYQAMGVSMGMARGEMAKMSVDLTKLAADMASFYNVEQKDVAEDLESVFTGMTRPLRAYGLDLTQATLSQWAMRNGMEVNMKTMSQAEKTMLRYQYVLANTGAAQGDFARTQNTWANQTRILRQNFEQLGIVIGGTLINSLKPLVSALNNAMGSIISFAETVSNALGQIFGWKYEVNTGGIANDFEDIAGSTGDIASGLGDAEKAAKKLKSYVLGIDELNIIEPNKDTGASGGAGGGGGTGGTIGSGAEGNWIKTDSIFEKYKSEIDTLYKLGDYIGKTITNTLNGIDWDKVYQGAKNFGKGLADFLNGLISPELFGAVGKTIAGALNTAIYASLSFAKNFDFKDFGKSLAEAINKFFETFDFKALAESINEWAQGIKDTIITTLKEVEWKKVFKGLADFLNELELESVAIIIGVLTIKSVGKAVLGFSLLGFIKTFLTNAIKKAPIALSGIKILLTGGLIKDGGFLAKIGNVIALVVGGAGTLAESVSAVFGPIGTVIGGVVGTIGGAFMAITNFLNMITNGFSWAKEGLMLLGTAITAVGAVILGAPALVTGVITAVVGAIATLVVVIKDNWESIKKWFSNIPSWISKNVIQPTVDFFKEMATKISNFFSNCWDGIKEIWKNVSSWFNEKVIQPVVGIFKTLVSKISGFLSNCLKTIKEIWGVVSSWFSEKVIAPVTNIFKKLGESIGEFLSKAKTSVTNTWSVVSSWFNEKVITPITNHFSNIFTKIKTGFSEALKKVKEIWGGVSSWFSEKVLTPIKKAFKTVTEAIGKMFSNVFDGIRKAVVGAMNGVISVIEKCINGVVSAINGLTKGLNKVVSWAGKVANKDWSSVGVIDDVSLPRIPAYEFGGYPAMGDLFFANENGVPELVGTIGGRTAVASGTEITGISDAVYSTGGTQAMLLQTAISLLQEISDKDLSVNIGDREIARANTRGQKSMGVRLRTN